MTLYQSLIVYLTDTFFRKILSNKSISTSINIKGNIICEGILKHRKYRRCELSFFLFFFFIYRESWRGHCPWIVSIQNHFNDLSSSVFFMFFLKCGLLDDNILLSTRFVNSTGILTGHLHWFLLKRLLGI